MRKLTPQNLRDEVGDLFENDHTQATYARVLTEVSTEIHDTAVRNWGVDDQHLHRDLLLLHEEVSEAARTDREGLDKTALYRSDAGKLEGLGAELADIIIRCCSVAGAHGVPLVEALMLKMHQNTQRGREPGKAY